MLPRWADRLSAVRQRLFVGRDAERALFQSILDAPELPVQVLYVFGPGGIGKTTLLEQFAVLCAQADASVTRVDARTIEPSPEVFLAALHRALGGMATDSQMPSFDSVSRHVLLIDTYELLTPLDSWLRETFLPQLPTHVLVVLAGRQPPAPAWRADPGWQTLVRVLPLRNLSPDESRRYMQQRAIDENAYAPFLEFTHGHPLALSLFADVLLQRPNIHLQPTDAPDVIRTLLEHLVQKVPGPAHRAALEVCALVRLTSEGLLADVLRMPDAHELFEWLCGLSFIETRPHGLFPHDLARETLHADLRWRNPDWYAELHRRVRAYYSARLHQAQGIEQQRTLFDYIYLHRDNMLVRPFFEWQARGNSLIDRMRPDDLPLLIDIVRRHEGDAAARLAEHWAAEQPQGVLVVRGAEQQPVGLLIEVALHEASPAAIEADPGTRAAWAYLQAHAPLRQGEGAIISRFWMAHDTYQAISPTQSMIGVTMVRQYLTTSGLAFSFFPCADPDFWAPLCSYTEFERIATADFEVDGRRYGVYGHDWRTMPPLAWLSLLGERELAMTPAPAPASRPSLVVLSQPAFEAAVRAALQHYTRASALHSNPLLQSRLVIERAGSSPTASQRVRALQTLIGEAVQALQASPRQIKWYRALHHTYLQPAATQEQAAELLDVPFSSYRRHLKAGIEAVAAMLWETELHGIENEHQK